jgi:proteasome assembly chaperone (PAC2) family protein
MTSLYSMVEQPDLEAPVLVMVLKGWIDAGLGADGAADVLIEGLDRHTIARFDADALLDWRARRPTMRLVDGINTQITWEETELSWAKDGSGNDVLLLLGNEPDHAWLAFSEQVVDLALDLGARMAVGLGAYPTPVPHTRTPLLAASASSEDLAQGLLQNSVEVPSGIQGMIERRAALRGLPALGLWAQVPHYAGPAPGHEPHRRARPAHRRPPRARRCKPLAHRRADRPEPRAHRHARAARVAGRPRGHQHPAVGHQRRRAGGGAGALPPRAVTGPVPEQPVRLRE